MSTPRLLAGAALAISTALLLGGCSYLAEPGPGFDDDDEFGTVQTYDVLDDGTLDPPATGLAGEVWDTFTRVTTMDFASTALLQYRVGDAADSDTLAYVYEDYRNPKLWILAANLATSNDHEELIATLIHEYAHILTLQQSQMVENPAVCPTLYLDEGCAAPDSMLRAFDEQFWAQYGSDAPDASNNDSDVAYTFYLAHEEDFVDDYAATNVIEDVAETFMTWVLQDSSDGDTLLAHKLQFFANYPQMVTIRERIRTEFADELGLAV